MARSQPQQSPANGGGARRERAAMGPHPRRPAPSAARARWPPRLLQVSRGHAPGSASTRPRARAAVAEHASYLLVEGDGLVLIVPVLAAVGGTGLHHPSGPPHFPSAREAGEGAVCAAALGFDTLAAFGGFDQQLRGRLPHRGGDRPARCGVCFSRKTTAVARLPSSRWRRQLQPHLSRGFRSQSLISRR